MTPYFSAPGVELFHGDCREWLTTLADDSVDLVLCSPPYEAARTYGIDFAVKGQAWADWMFGIIKECSRICKGLICVVCEGQTKNYAYSAAPILLMADLHRAGFNLRKPPAFARVGIPGSGGPDWLRNDYEFCVCVTREGKLPWSDTTACGHPPKWAPGGEMSNRLGSGSRRNQWGGKSVGPHERNAEGERKPSTRPSHVEASIRELQLDDGIDIYAQNGQGDQGSDQDIAGGIVETATSQSSDEVLPRAKSTRNAFGVTNTTTRRRTGSGKREVQGREVKQISARNANGVRDDEKGESYTAPVKANPGNVIKCKVGGGLMGHPLAHENEAPYPLKLAEFFVQSFCPPGGLVCDPFLGSGTTGHACLEHGRRFMGCDIRESQCDLAKRRLKSVTPCMFTEAHT